MSKVILVGSTGVGKTCFAKRFVDDDYTEGGKATVGVDLHIQHFKILGYPFALQIWDTAGQEKFKTITKHYYRGASAVILAFDLGNMESFDQCNDWLSEINNECNNDFLIFLCGMKCDSSHIISWEMGEAKACSFGSEYWECSSKNGINVSSLFDHIACCLYRKHLLTFEDDRKKKGNTKTSNESFNIGSGISLGEDYKKTSTSKTSCQCQ